MCFSCHPDVAEGRSEYRSCAVLQSAEGLQLPCCRISKRGGSERRRLDTTFFKNNYDSVHTDALTNRYCVLLSFRRSELSEPRPESRRLLSHPALHPLASETEDGCREISDESTSAFRSLQEPDTARFIPTGRQTLRFVRNTANKIDKIDGLSAQTSNLLT